MTASSSLAGKPAPATLLVDVPRLLAAYYAEHPDAAVAGERVRFGTSGHRGSSLSRTFNEAHILAITQAICLYRRSHGIDGPLFLGKDTHALSEPAFVTALEVLAANGVDVMIDRDGRFTPTPVISHAIVGYNRGRRGGFADGIVVTPSHNPPEDGGFKYNPLTGGPAGTDVTAWIEDKANSVLAAGLRAVRRMPGPRARAAGTTHLHDYITPYVDDLGSVIDVEAIRAAGVRIGVDPLGGAAAHYWEPIAARYGLDVTIVHPEIDPTFRFVPVDWDGRIRTDCSSPFTMTRLVAVRERFDIACATDADADRHGIVTPADGLMNPNHYLAVAIAYLFAHRPSWSSAAAVGKTLVSSSMIDRAAATVRRRIIEVPVGFKWFVAGLLDGSLGFCGEESAGASLQRIDGTTWTTDKDGIVLGLLAAEITANLGIDPGARFHELEQECGATVYERIDVRATSAQRHVIDALAAPDIEATSLAGEPVRTVTTTAAGNGAAMGGVKVVAEHGWWAVRPSGTEDVYKLYAESYRSPAHLTQIQHEAQHQIANLLASRGPGTPGTEGPTGS